MCPRYSTFGFKATFDAATLAFRARALHIKNTQQQQCVIHSDKPESPNRIPITYIKQVPGFRSLVHLNMHIDRSFCSHVHVGMHLKFPFQFWISNCLLLGLVPGSMLHSKTCSIRRHMEWKKKLQIVYDGFDKGLGIRPIARKNGVSPIITIYHIMKDIWRVCKR